MMTLAQIVKGDASGETLADIFKATHSVAGEARNTGGEWTAGGVWHGGTPPPIPPHAAPKAPIAGFSAAQFARPRLVEKIKKDFAEVTPAEIAEGKKWFAFTNKAAQKLSKTYKVPLDKVIGIIAAFSPALAWERNIYIAEQYLKNPKENHGQYEANYRKADRIMAGEPPLSVLGSKRYQKTQNFFRCIANPQDPVSVTIDRHAVAVALGRPLNASDADTILEHGEYSRFADAYRETAQGLGLLPSELQSITWAHWRKTHALQKPPKITKGSWPEDLPDWLLPEQGDPDFMGFTGDAGENGKHFPRMSASAQETDAANRENLTKADVTGEARDKSGKWTASDPGPDDPGGEVIRPEGWQAPNDTVRGWTRPEHLYRGMTADEFAAHRKAGSIQSNGAYSVPGEGTPFSDDADTAESYANFGRDDPRRTGKPTYMVEIPNDPEQTPQDKRDGYFKAQKPIPLDSVTRAWKMQARGGAVVAHLIHSTPSTLDGNWQRPDYANDVQLVPIKELQAINQGYLRNPDTKKLAHAISIAGIEHPVKVAYRPDGKLCLIDGNHRIDALAALGHTHVPTIVRAAFDYEYGDKDESKRDWHDPPKPATAPIRRASDLGFTAEKPDGSTVKIAHARGYLPYFSKGDVSGEARDDDGRWTGGSKRATTEEKAAFDKDHDRYDDNPGGAWEARNPKTNTAGYHKNFMMPAKWLAGLRGKEGEEKRIFPGDERVEKLADSMREGGYDGRYPVFINVEHDGEPWINEGNHRARAAVRAGLTHVPVELRFYGGGEKRFHPLDVLANDDNPVPSLPPVKPFTEKEIADQAERNKRFVSVWDKPRPKFGIQDALDELLVGKALAKADHDVSGEPRAEDGEWTAGGGSAGRKLPEGARVTKPVDGTYTMTVGEPVTTKFGTTPPREVARVSLSDDKTHVTSVTVDPAYRRQGIASAMYEHIERELGHPLTPSPAQTEDGKAFSDARAAKALETAQAAHEAKYGKKAGHIVETCPTCHGKGVLPHFYHVDNGRCFTCGGRGKVDTVIRQPKSIAASEARAEEERLARVAERDAREAKVRERSPELYDALKDRSKLERERFGGGEGGGAQYALNALIDGKGTEEGLRRALRVAEQHLIDTGNLSPQDVTEPKRNSKGFLRSDDEMGSQHVGTVGEKMTRKVTLIKPPIEIQGQYGTSYLCLLRDEDGNSIKWFASNPWSVFDSGLRGPYATDKGTLNVGDSADLEFKVKAHNERDGVRETAVTNVKFAKPAKAPKKQKMTLADLFGIDDDGETLAELFKLDHDVSGESRDNTGEWTRGGGGGTATAPKPRVFVPAASGVGKDKYDAGRITTPNGGIVRGTPIPWDDPRIPPTIYHVSPYGNEIERTGMLLGAGEGGLGGDSRDQIVSFTIDPKIADGLKDDIQTMIRVARAAGPEPPFPGHVAEFGTPEYAKAMQTKAVWGRKLATAFQAEAKRQGWNFDLDNYDNPDTLGTYGFGDWTIHFFNRRPYQLRQNPIFMNSKSENFAKLDPANVSTFAIPRENLNTGALVTNFDLGQHSLEEVREYGDVPITGAVRKAQQIGALHVYGDVPATGYMIRHTAPKIVKADVSGEPRAQDGKWTDGGGGYEERVKTKKSSVEWNARDADGKPAAEAAAWFTDHPGAKLPYLATLLTYDGHEGKGLASRGLAALKAKLAAQGHTHVRMDPLNDTARHLNRKTFGEPVGRNEGGEDLHSLTGDQTPFTDPSDTPAADKPKSVRYSGTLYHATDDPNFSLSDEKGDGFLGPGLYMTDHKPGPNSAYGTHVQTFNVKNLHLLEFGNDHEYQLARNVYNKEPWPDRAFRDAMLAKGYEGIRVQRGIPGVVDAYIYVAWKPTTTVMRKSDVSGEARADDGEWTAGGGAPAKKPKIVARYDLRTPEEARGEGNEATEPRECDRCGRLHHVVYEVEHGEGTNLVGGGCAKQLLANKGMDMDRAKDMIADADRSHKVKIAAAKSLAEASKRLASRMAEEYAPFAPAEKKFGAEKMKADWEARRERAIALLHDNVRIFSNIAKMPLDEIAGLDRKFARDVATGYTFDENSDVPKELRKADHDVSGEPRDNSGEWTAGGGGTPNVTPYRTGTPATITYLHNETPAPKMRNGEFGTDVEPHGRYLTGLRDDEPTTPMPGYSHGTVTFKNPLVIPFGGGYNDETNWKRKLSAHYGGKTGRALSNAIVKDGHDGIITHDKHGTSEIVDLTSLKGAKADEKDADEPDDEPDDKPRSAKEAMEHVVAKLKKLPSVDFDGMLYHTTTAPFADGITRDGFKTGISHTAKLFGAGTYFYTDSGFGSAYGDTELAVPFKGKLANVEDIAEFQSKIKYPIMDHLIKPYAPDLSPPDAASMANEATAEVLEKAGFDGIILGRVHMYEVVVFRPQGKPTVSGTWSGYHFEPKALEKAEHDVSGEPRDRTGEWTAGGGSGTSGGGIANAPISDLFKPMPDATFKPKWERLTGNLKPAFFTLRVESGATGNVTVRIKDHEALVDVDAEISPRDLGSALKRVVAAVRKVHNDVDTFRITNERRGYHAAAYHDAKDEIVKRLFERDGRPNAVFGKWHNALAVPAKPSDLANEEVFKVLKPEQRAKVTTAVARELVAGGKYMPKKLALLTDSAIPGMPHGHDAIAWATQTHQGPVVRIMTNKKKWDNMATVAKESGQPRSLYISDALEFDQRPGFVMTHELGHVLDFALQHEIAMGLDGGKLKKIYTSFKDEWGKPRLAPELSKPEVRPSEYAITGGWPEYFAECYAGYRYHLTIPPEAKTFFDAIGVSKEMAKQNPGLYLVDGADLDLPIYDCGILDDMCDEPIAKYGTAASGDWDHLGRPGHVGGSSEVGGKNLKGVMRQIASIQDKAKHTPNDPATKAAYAAFIRETEQQYDDLKKRGYTFEFGTRDPYRNSQDMTKQLDKTKHMIAWNVADDLPKDHPLAVMSRDGQTANSIFRAVHDFNGHYFPGNTFGQRGELKAYQAHSKMYSAAALPALAAETLAQGAWLNYGPNEKRSVQERQFPEQKSYAFPADIASAISRGYFPKRFAVKQ